MSSARSSPHRQARHSNQPLQPSARSPLSLAIAAPLCVPESARPQSIRALLEIAQPRQREVASAFDGAPSCHWLLAPSALCLWPAPPGRPRARRQAHKSRRRRGTPSAAYDLHGPLPRTPPPGKCTSVRTLNSSHGTGNDSGVPLIENLPMGIAAKSIGLRQTRHTVSGNEIVAHYRNLRICPQALIQTICSTILNRTTETRSGISFFASFHASAIYGYGRQFSSISMASVT